MTRSVSHRLRSLSASVLEVVSVLEVSAVAAVLVAATAATGLTACGGPSSNGLERATAAEVGGRAVEALRGASSVHVVGDVERAGRDEGSRYDLVVSGESARGTIQRHGTEHEIIKAGGSTYVRADGRYYESLGEADAAPLLAGRWVQLPGEHAGAYDSYTQEGFALEVQQLAGALAGPVTAATLDDEKAVRASSSNGSTLWAANTGEAYPLRLEIAGTDTGTLEFSDYGADVSIETPADAVPLSRVG